MEIRVYTLVGASKVVGVGYQTLSKEVHAGRLKAARINDDPPRYRISRKDLAEWWQSKGGGELP